GPGLPLADPRVPPDYIAIHAARTAENALQSGYTSVRSCGSTFFVDQAVKLGIERGLIKGPRLKPSGPEITATGGVIASMPSWAAMRTEGLVITVDGPIEARNVARRLIRDGTE